VVSINIIDYLADSLEVPEVSSDVSEITVTTRSGIKINNYTEILNYDQNNVVIKLNKGYVTFSGNNLNITYINEKYIVLSGEVFNLNFEGCD